MRAAGDRRVTGAADFAVVGTDHVVAVGECLRRLEPAGRELAVVTDDEHPVGRRLAHAGVDVLGVGLAFLADDEAHRCRCRCPQRRLEAVPVGVTHQRHDHVAPLHERLVGGRRLRLEVGDQRLPVRRPDLLDVVLRSEADAQLSDLLKVGLVRLRELVVHVDRRGTQVARCLRCIPFELPDDRPAVADQFALRREVRSDDGRAARLRFDHRDAEPFAPARGEQHVTAAVERRHHLRREADALGIGVGEDQGVHRDSGVLGEFHQVDPAAVHPEPVGVDDEHGVLVVLPERTEGTEGFIEALAVLRVLVHRDHQHGKGVLRDAEHRAGVLALAVDLEVRRRLVVVRVDCQRDVQRVESGFDELLLAEPGHRHRRRTGTVEELDHGRRCGEVVDRRPGEHLQVVHRNSAEHPDVGQRDHPAGRQVALEEVLGVAAQDVDRVLQPTRRVERDRAVRRRPLLHADLVAVCAGDSDVVAVSLETGDEVAALHAVAGGRLGRVGGDEELHAAPTRAACVRYSRR